MAGGAEGHMLFVNSFLVPVHVEGRIVLPYSLTPVHAELVNYFSLAVPVI